MRGLLSLLCAAALGITVCPAQTAGTSVVPAGGVLIRPVPFTSIRPDQRLWKARNAPLRLGSVNFSAGLETPHFVIAGTGKVRSDLTNSFAEAGERICLEMKAELPQFFEVLSERRLLVLITENEENMKDLGHWYAGEMRAADWTGELARAEDAERWLGPGISYISLRTDFMERNNVVDTARVFRADRLRVRDLRNPVWAERIHFLTSTLFGEGIDGIDADGPYNLGGLRLAYAYYKEWRAAGRIRTEVLYSNSDREIEGFSRGKNWMQVIKGTLKEASPAIDQLLGSKVTEMHPRDVGFAFGLMHFIHSNPERLKAFDRLLRHMHEVEKVTNPENFARGLGFESAAKLDAEWMRWMDGGNFR